MWRRGRGFLRITNWILVIFITGTFLSVVSVLFAKDPIVTALNTRMSLVMAISSFGAMVFAAVALVVSIAALKVATQSPELLLAVDNGSTLTTQNPTLRAEIHRDTHRILATQPTAHWRLFLTNVGNASARYPLVRVEFHDVRVQGNLNLKDWSPVSTSQIANTVVQWTYPPNSDTVIHPKFPYEISQIDLRRRIIGTVSGVAFPKRIKLTITLAADGFFRDGLEWFIELDDTTLNYDLENWVKQTFNVGSDGMFSLPQQGGGIVSIPAETLLRQYNGPVPPTFESLISANLGETWNRLFQDWSTKDLILPK